MLFPALRGIIALDIDGTVTAQRHDIDSTVIEALSHYAAENWGIIFITGRPFQWGEVSLRPLQFPYMIGVQNGALLLEMPLQKVLLRKYLSKETVLAVEEVVREYETSFVIYSGWENEDRCYYCPSLLPPHLLTYGLHRAEQLEEKWEPLQTFADLPFSQFASIKFFDTEKRAMAISKGIQERLGLHAPPNRDPFNPDFFVIQATHSEANKGHALKEFLKTMKISVPVIAAGDDYNDFSMLQAADIKIVMANAPDEILAAADIIAPPAKQHGIIQGLKEAMHLIKAKGKGI